MFSTRGRRIRPHVESLEGRDLPSVAPLVTENFDTTSAGNVPAGWSRWSSGADQFGASAALPVTPGNGLADSTATTGLSARAWLSDATPANVRVSADVRLDSAIPAQVLARGTALDTPTPTYYALEITQGLSLSLVKVVGGARTSLGTLSSSAALGNPWVRATLEVQGNTLRAQVVRLDNGQYLDPTGAWVTGPTFALITTDGDVTGPGSAGLGRAAGTVGTVSFDDFSATALTESFDSTPAGQLPAGWSQWTGRAGDGAYTVAADPGTPPSSPNGLSNSVTGVGSTPTRAWDSNLLASDVRVSASIYLNTTIYSQVIARGSGLDTTTPTYYALQLQRGLTAELIKVVNGTTTVLGELKSSLYYNGVWTQATLDVTGSTITAQVRRLDNGQYLNAAGAWQDAPTSAMTVTDASPITAAGQVGVARGGGGVGTITFDDFSAVSTATPPAAVNEGFNTQANGALPADWSQWSSQAGDGTFATTSARSFSATQGLANTTTNSTTASRAWQNTFQAANVGVSAAVYLDSLSPTQLFARGSGLNTASPSYYAVRIDRNLALQLVKVVNGTSTPLTSLSGGYFGGHWVNVTLQVSGTTVRAQVVRTDNGQYLSSSGVWQDAPTFALVTADADVSGAGLVGVARPGGTPSVVGTFTVDDFSAQALTGDTQAPSVTITAPAAGSTVTGMVTVQTAASDDTGVAKAELYVDGVLQSTTTAAPFSFTWDSSQVPDGTHTLLVKVYDAAFNLGQASVTVNANNGPLVAITNPANGSTLPAGVDVIQASATDNVAITRVEFYVDGTLRPTVDPLAQSWSFDTRTVLNGTHTITVKEYDADGNAGQASVTITTKNRIAIPEHYSWIRTAHIAFSGWTPNQQTHFDDNLLKNSLDLVISSQNNLQYINNLAPNTPQTIYTNVSSIYTNLLEDWLTYADAHGINREDAFFHVTQPRTFTAAGGSTVPVRNFWGALRQSGTTWTNLATGSDKLNATTNVTLAPAGGALYLGQLDPFREIDVSVQTPPGAGWRYVIEYASAVDATCNPTAWKTLNATDPTAGFTKSGTITFDPPTDWKTARLQGSAPLYYVRIRTTSGGTPPVAQLHGRDYVNANGGDTWTIPVFDYSADTNHDGYLSDAEYANRKPGDNARFVYETRDFSDYGQMRYITNAANVNFRNWAVDYNKRLLAASPLADGLFVDNSAGTPGSALAHVAENATNYASDYAGAVQAVYNALPNALLVPNTSYFYPSASPTIQDTGVAYWESGLRPENQTWNDLERIAAQEKSVSQLSATPPLQILATLLNPTDNPSDPRLQLASLSYYYLLSDPNTTFLDLFGNERSGSWSDNWTQAISANVGLPTGAFSTAVTGSDPENSALTYKVYQRTFTNATVLFKPLSYTLGKGAGALDNATATTVQLGGSYYVLNSNGTTGTTPVSQITLRNGEGAILMNHPIS
jgi:Bacterial Ig domain